MFEVDIYWGTEFQMRFAGDYYGLGISLFPDHVLEHNTYNMDISYGMYIRCKTKTEERMYAQKQT